MPKKSGKNVNPSDVDHINVFDGNTGIGFSITDSEDKTEDMFDIEAVKC